MSDFINRDDLITQIEKINCVDYGTMDSYEAHNAVRDCLYDIQNLIYNMPTAEVVHCKDCKYYYPNNGTFYKCDRPEGRFPEIAKWSNGYCCYGKRKENQ